MPVHLAVDLGRKRAPAHRRIVQARRNAPFEEYQLVVRTGGDESGKFAGDAR